MSYELLPNTGVQFIILPSLFTEEEVERFRPEFRVKHSVSPEVQRLDGDGLARRAGADDGYSEESPFLAAPAATPGLDGGTVVADLRFVLNEMQIGSGGDNHWIPLPFNATAALWALLWVSRQPDGKCWDGVLAIDTTTSVDGSGGLLPQNDLPLDATLEPVALGVFWLSDPIKAYIERHFIARLRRKGAAEPGHPIELSRGAIQAHLAGFYSFLRERERFPSIRIAAPREDNTRDIPIELIIDLGNSRTCGLICEEREDRKVRYEILKLRNLDRPIDHLPYAVDTQLAFTSPNWTPLPGAPTFKRLSVICLGRPAIERLGSCQGDVSQLGMSSPKRYVWDGGRRSEPWRVADGSHCPTIHGPLLARIGQTDPFVAPAVPRQDPMDPAYPRKTGVLFCMVELLEQAFSQANSVEYRSAPQAAARHARRLIRNVVVMHPAGMDPAEVDEFGAPIERACQLWAEFRTDPIALGDGREVPIPPRTGIPVPKVHQICDEGLSLQMCYLYGEAVHRYNARSEPMVDTLGRMRDGGRVLRLASLDIGGGTIDMAVADYRPITAAHGVAFERHRLFHDGMTSAGDDVIRRLLEEIVFPQIAEQMHVPISQWNNLFTNANASDEWTRARRHLVNDLWVPLAHRCLGQLEIGERCEIDVAGCVSRRQAIEVLDRHLKSVRQPRKGAEPLPSVQQVRVSIDAPGLLAVVRRTIGGTLSQCCDLIAQFRSDVLLVGGRLSSLPAVRDILVEELPVPPGRIVLLHEQEIGDWYPFTRDGRVGDAKTCAVVGAALAYQAQHGMGEFVLRDTSNHIEVPHVLGVLNSHDMRLDRLLFPNGGAISEEIMMWPQQELVVGMQRVRDDRAQARPNYHIVIDPHIRGCLRRQPVDNDPLQFRLKLETVPDRRRGVEYDRVSINDVRGTVKFLDDDGQHRSYSNRPELLRCRLKTMVEQDYWLDSGVFGEVIQAP